MIRALRERNVADRFLNDVRADRKRQRRLGRYVYLVLLALLFGYLVQLFAGPYLWLQAEGMVLSDQITIASPYGVQVVEMMVSPGQRVRRGDSLVKVQAPQVIDSMAELTSRLAESAARQSDAAVKVEVARALLKSATERFEENDRLWKEVLAKNKETGFISEAFISNAQNNRYAALSEKATREAELRAGLEQLDVLSRSHKAAENALDELRRTYNDGVIVAPQDGLVGAKVATPGDVSKAGEPLLQLHVGKPYALAYLPTGALFEVDIGEKVKVADNFKEGKGHVSAILPVTDRLPAEFQKTYHPPTRAQVARIDLDDPSIFPMSTTVRVTGGAFLNGNKTVQAAKDAVGKYLNPDAITRAASEGWTKIAGLLPLGAGDAMVHQ